LVAEQNKEVMREVADALLSKGRVRMSDNGQAQVVDLTLDDLHPVASRLSTSVLNIASRWGF
jgi:predicted methyltransferase MtxX (methanogen marker protein 4)